jgi:hypothetical protein
VPVVREILMDAWTIGRTTPRALNLVFRMASPEARSATFEGAMAGKPQHLERTVGGLDRHG